LGGRDTRPTGLGAIERGLHNDNTEVAYKGAAARYGGVFEFDDTDLAAGNVIDLWVFGS
jgi:hypothetical protein